jgi:hypothetical protein
MGTGGFSPEGEAAIAWSWPLTFNQSRGQEIVDLYIYSPMRLHGVVLNEGLGQLYLYAYILNIKICKLYVALFVVNI